MSAARNARKATRKAGKLQQAAELQRRTAEVQRLARAADLLAAHVDVLDAVGHCREARATERKSIDLAVRSSLLAANVDHIEPLPSDVIRLLDSIVSDVLVGDIAAADQHRQAAIDALRRDRETHQPAPELTLQQRADLALAHCRAWSLEHQGLHLEAAFALAVAEERFGPASLLTRKGR